MLYVARQEFKASVSIPDTTTDADVDMALEAASRAIEKVTQRRFWLDAEDVTRSYTANTSRLVMVDDVASITEVTSDGTVVTDYTAEPLNSDLDQEPFLWLASDDGAFSVKRGAVKVTGRFGWPVIPGQVPEFVTIAASKLLKRAREAPWGVVTAGGIEGHAIRLARQDPDLQFLLGPLMRNHPVVA